MYLGSSGLWDLERCLVTLELRDCLDTSLAWGVLGLQAALAEDNVVFRVYFIVQLVFGCGGLCCGNYTLTNQSLCLTTGTHCHPNLDVTSAICHFSYEVRMLFKIYRRPFL